MTSASCFASVSGLPMSPTRRARRAAAAGGTRSPTRGVPPATAPAPAAPSRAHGRRRCGQQVLQPLDHDFASRQSRSARSPPCRARPGAAGIVAICGKLSSGSSGSAGRMRTRTSYQPAWPVIGSELLMVSRPAPERQLLADQVVQQEALARLVGTGRELPGAVGLADRVPGPHRAGLDRLAVAQHAAHLAPLALDPAPAAVGDAGGRRGHAGSPAGSCGCGSAAARRSANPTSGTSPSAAA